VAPKNQVRIEHLIIDNRLGDVTVVGRDGPTLTLTVVKRAPDEDTLERLKVNLEPDPSGNVRIGATLLVGQEARPVPAGAGRIDLVLEAPRQARVEVRAWKGTITVTGMHGGAALVAHHADIRLRGVRGTVSTSNTRGHQDLVGVEGTIQADNTYGDLALDRIRGDSLAARVHEGRVVATHVRSRSVLLRTTYGDIVFSGELIHGGRYDLGAYRGRLEVRIPEGTPFRLEAYARRGSIDPQLELAEVDRPELGRMVGSYGAARRRPALLLLSSLSGDVLVGLLTE
jgi:hypothetical protein